MRGYGGELLRDFFDKHPLAHSCSGGRIILLLIEQRGQRLAHLFASLVELGPQRSLRLWIIARFVQHLAPLHLLH